MGVSAWRGVKIFEMAKIISISHQRKTSMARSDVKLSVAWQSSGSEMAYRAIAAWRYRRQRQRRAACHVASTISHGMLFAHGGAAAKAGGVNQHGEKRKWRNENGERNEENINGEENNENVQYQ
jgi:hypothetical protein